MNQKQNMTPAVGRGKMSFGAAFAAWMNLVLQDEISGDSSHPVFSASIIEMLARNGAWGLVAQVIDGIWGDWAPLGYGTGPASSVSWPEEKSTRLTFGWDGYWTSGRWIMFHLPEVPPEVEYDFEGGYASWLYSQEVIVEWNSGTGQSSTFISSTLEGVEEIEEKEGEEWRAYIAPISEPDCPGRGGRGRVEEAPVE
ncbi:MAG: hypothetical protein WC552_08320 [Candidatus Omnitrophota bacterium]